jgi:SAM-dependent methyltransferase
MTSKVPEYFNNVRSELVPFIQDDAFKVLEIGCGSGNFINNFRNHVEYWGIEPNKKASNIAKRKAFKILNDIYENIHHRLPNSYFDLIICNDVIEHMQDHDFFFNSIKEKLASTGFIIGSVPNVRFYMNLIKLLIYKDWRYEDEGILDRTHLRFFTMKSLKNTLQSYKFIIIEIKGINSIDPKDSYFKFPLKFILCLLLGLDSKHRQIAFRIKK